MRSTDAVGEQDAVVIPFPQHRVRPHDAVTPHASEAHIVELPVDLTDDEPSVAPPVVVPTAEGSPRAVTDRPSRVERRAHNVSVHALATRGQSTQEIETRMRSKDIPDEVIAAEVERLEAIGLVDDSELAAELVDKYAKRGGLGRRGVAEKLRQRKIPAEIIEQALSVLSDDDEATQLREVAEARARSLTNLPAEVASRRLIAYLNRRGFSGDAVYQVAKQVLA